MDLEGQERTNQQKLVFVIKIDRRDGSYKLHYSQELFATSDEGLETNGNNENKMCTMFYTASRGLIPAVIPLAKNTGHSEEVHLAAKNGSRKMTWRNFTIWPRCSSPQGKSKKRYETVVWRELKGKK